MTPDRLSIQFVKSYPRQAARVLEQLSAENLALFISSLPDSDTANILGFMIPSMASDCLELINPEKAGKIINQMTINTAAGLLRRMEHNGRKTILSQLQTTTATLLKLSLRYPVGLVGSLMNPDVLAVPGDVRISHVVGYARGNKNKLYSAVYIIDDTQRLLGCVDIKDLLIADDDVQIKDLMKAVEYKLSARSSLISIQDHPGWKILDVIPVVDHKDVFQGGLTRSIIADALADSHAKEDGDVRITDTVISLAEVFWNTCTDVLVKDISQKEIKGSDDDKSDK